MNAAKYFLLLLFLYTIPVKGQPITFTQVHQIQDAGFHFTIEKLNDGYMIFSRSIDSATLADLACISKVDEWGNILWTKCYGDTSVRLWPGWARSFGMLPDSTFYAGGSRDYGPGISRALLFRFDSNGDTIFTKEYGGTTPGSGFVIAYTARSDSDGGFVLAGSTDNTINGKHDFYIVKTDSLGNKVWERAIGDYKHEDVADMEIMANGDIYVSGSSESFFGTPPGAIQPCVAKLNSSGNLLWFRNYNTLTPEFDNGSLAYLGKLDEKHLLVLAARKKQNAGYAEMPVIFKIDTAGTIVWEREYSDSILKLTIVSAFFKNNDYEYLIGGGILDLTDPNYPFSAVICKFDSSGNLLLTRKFSEPGYHFQNLFIDMIPTPDGIAAVGFATAPQTPWMVKIDNNLCFGPDSCGPNLPVSRQVSEVTPPLSALLPYPNPIKDGIFTIPLPKVSLSSYQSRLASPPPNMMDPLGSDFPHIHRDAFSLSERKKSKPISQNFSEFSPIELMAYDLQGRSIPMQYEVKEGHIKVKILEPTPGIVLLKMHQEGKWWFGKVGVYE